MEIVFDEVDERDYDEFAALINAGGQLSWELTANRIKHKLGSTGTAIGAYDMTTDELVGGIAIKSDNELGYLYIDPTYRGSQVISGLFNKVKELSSHYPYLFMTVRSDNKTMNRILEFTRHIDYLGQADSRFTTNTLNVYVLSASDMDKARSQIEELYGPIY